MKFDFKGESDYILPVPRKELTFSVVGYISPDTQYVDRKGYVDKDTGKIFIYMEKIPKTKDFPMMFKNDEGEMEFVEPASPQTRKEFMTDNIYELSLKDVFKTPSDAKFFDEKVLDELNSSQEVYKPKIKAEDDALKKVIKAAIISKGVDINAYKAKVPEKPYIVSNIKHCIESSGKVSILNLIRFCELYGLDFEIAVVDNNTDKLGKLNKPILYSSKTDTVEF